MMYLLLLILVRYILLLNVVSGNLNATEKVDLLSKSIVGRPPYFSTNHGNSLKAINLTDVAAVTVFEKYIDYYYHHIDKFTDGEAVAAVEKYFYGRRDGLAIELGALDGKYLSQTLPLVTDLGWHRIIIEGSPNWRDDMSLHSPDAFAVSAAICKESQVIHYAEGVSSAGIAEFMSHEYLARFFYELSVTPQDKWDNLKNVKKQSCVTFNDVLSAANTTYVNWFLLDVEGAELTILESIDFSKVTFDVITVETERKFRPHQQWEKVTDLLKSKGYRFSWEGGRNTWYVNKNYTLAMRWDCEENRDCRRLGTPYLG